jgi:predicted outer membrane repeat protein
MKFAKRLLMVAGAVALAGLFSVMLAPKTVHAVVATLVQVENTSANPVPVSQSDLANDPFAASLCNGSYQLCEGVSILNGLTQVVYAPSFVVPSTDANGQPVRALVIQFISGICNASTAALETSAPANAANGVTSTLNFLNNTVAVSGGAPYVDQTTTIIAPAGSTVAIAGSGINSQSPACFLTVNGYLAH